MQRRDEGVVASTVLSRGAGEALLFPCLAAVSRSAVFELGFICAGHRAAEENRRKSCT